MTPFYLIHATYRGAPYIQETDTQSSTIGAAAATIFRGEYAGEVDRVLCVDLAAGTVTDVSAMTAALVEILSRQQRVETSSETDRFLRDHGFEPFVAEPEIPTRWGDTHTVLTRKAA